MPTPPPVRLGIDLGGTKIEIIALNPQGEELLRKRINTPREHYSDILSALIQLIQDCEATLGKQAPYIGIGIPGAISHKTGLIKNANTTALIGQALDRDLTQRLKRPVRLENDANCFALSESSDGAGQVYSSIFAVILGTGVGGALIVNKQLWKGRNANAGEWGHNPLPWNNQADEPRQPCYCGLSGCLETYLSGPGMAVQARLQHGLNETSQTLLAKKSGEHLYPEVYQAYVDRLARGLASIINVFDPDAIILGGGLSNLSSLYEDVPKVWQQYVFSDEVSTALLPNLHGDSSGVRGAAWLTPLSK